VTRTDRTEALTRLYAWLDAEVARRGWTCRACGECCHFARHGHELFCSALEAAYLFGDDASGEMTDPSVCPFLENERCTRRDRRTLSCRIYHCSASGGDEMSALSEEALSRLKRLHERLGLPWRYASLWRHHERRKVLLSQE